MKRMVCLCVVLMTSLLFTSATGNPDIKEQLRKGADINGRHYRNYVDGYNLLDYLSGKTDTSPRNEFWYVNDEDSVVAARYGDLKVTFLENRATQLQIWREPFIELRAPMLCNLRRDPFEKAQIGSNTYNDWYIDHPYVVVPIQGMAARFLMTMKEYPPSQTAGVWNLSAIESQLKNAAASN